MQRCTACESTPGVGINDERNAAMMNRVKSSFRRRILKRLGKYASRLSLYEC